MTASRPTPVAPWLLLIPLALCSCSSDTQSDHREQTGEAKREQDPRELVDELLKLFATCERERIRALVLPDLYEQLETSKTLDDICAVIGWLGRLRAAELLQTLSEDPGARSRYALTFERGELTLDLYVVDDKIAGLGLSGDDYLRAGRAAEAERYAKFAVHEVSYLTATGQPNPQGNVFEIGEVVVNLLVGGLEPDPEGTSHLQWQCQLIGSDGAVKWQDAEPQTSRFTPAPDQHVGAMNIRGRYTIPEADTLQVECTLHDQIGDQSITHTTTVVVVPASVSSERTSSANERE